MLMVRDSYFQPQIFVSFRYRKHSKDLCQLQPCARVADEL